MNFKATSIVLLTLLPPLIRNQDGRSTPLRRERA